MQLSLGTKIRELRHRDGRTQESLADALGVTSQAVSRWESGSSYPDMELMPSIANYFGVTIDELFGYHGDREQKIDAILRRVQEYDIKRSDDGVWVEECTRLLREGLAEFPANERLLAALADTLWEAGWRRNHGWTYYDDEGYIQYAFDKQKENGYWEECTKICESLAKNTKDNAIFTQAISILVPMHRNYGEFDKACAYARRMPKLQQSREFLLTEGTDGKANAKYVGEFLLESARQFSEQLVYGLIADLGHFDSDMPIEKIKGAIAIFDLICDDGNMGVHHEFVSKLYLYLSRLQWERGYHDETFVSLDMALHHAKSFDAVCDGKEHTLTAPLVSFVTYTAEEPKQTAATLSEDWPFWCNPDFRAVEKEIKADARWSKWAEKTKE